MKEDNQWNIVGFFMREKRKRNGRKLMLVSAESVGEKRREGLDCTTCCEARWRTWLCLRTGGDGSKEEGFGLVSPHEQSYSARKRVQSYLTKAEWVLGGCSLPGEHPGKLISKSVGVQT